MTENPEQVSNVLYPNPFDFDLPKTEEELASNIRRHRKSYQKFEKTLENIKKAQEIVTNTLGELMMNSGVPKDPVNFDDISEKYVSDKDLCAFVGQKTKQVQDSFTSMPKSFINTDLVSSLGVLGELKRESIEVKTKQKEFYEKNLEHLELTERLVFDFATDHRIRFRQQPDFIVFERIYQNNPEAEYLQKGRAILIKHLALFINKGAKSFSNRLDDAMLTELQQELPDLFADVKQLQEKWNKAGVLATEITTENAKVGVDHIMLNAKAFYAQPTEENRQIVQKSAANFVKDLNSVPKKHKAFYEFQRLQNSAKYLVVDMNTIQLDDSKVFWHRNDKNFYKNIAEFMTDCNENLKAIDYWAENS